MNKFTILIVSVFLPISCSNTTNAGKDLELELDKAYEALYLANFGLEYPPNKKSTGCVLKTTTNHA